jgi:hypothetical protein
MHAKQPRFERLALDTRRGDPDAGAKLQRELEPQLVYIVRQALREGNNDDPLTQRIRKEAQWILEGSRKAQQDDQDHVVGQVAHRLCETIVANLTATAQPRQWLLETVGGP